MWEGQFDTVGEYEFHPHNAAVVRTLDGVWMEDYLPILDWEDPAQRLVLPADLHASLAPAIPPVLRWADQKFRIVLQKHPDDRDIIHSLSNHMVHWRFHGQETGTYAGNQRILIQVTNRWYAVSIGTDENGSHNVVTVFGASRSLFLVNRLKSLENIVEREK